MIYPTAAEMSEHAKWSRGLPADRFAASYVVEPNGCWQWTSAKTTAGYGHFHMLGAYYQAHRISYILHVGPVPSDLTLDHLCRNRACVNPAHLEPVTQAENTRRGIGTKLNREKIATLRRLIAAGASQRSLADRFGVDHSTISRAVRGSRWAETRTDVAA